MTVAVGLLLVLLALSLYLGFYLNPGKASIYTTTDTTVSQLTVVAPTTETVTATTSIITTRLITTTLQGIIPPINNVLIANISLPQYTWNVAVNPKTNMIYSIAPLTNLTVINGTTDRIIASVNVGAYGSNYVAVNPATDFVYAGSDVLNSSTNRIVGDLGYNISGIAIDPGMNVIFALSSDNAPRGNTSLLVLSGFNNSLIATFLLNGTANSIALNPKTHVVYVPICSSGSVCAPIYLLAINGLNYNITAKILIDTDQAAGVPFAVAVDPQNNMVYMTDRELVSVNGSTNHLVAKTIVGAYTIQCRGVAVNSQHNEIYVTGWRIGNYGSFFIVNGANYSLLNAFAGTGQPVSIAYDPTNTEIYVANSQTKSVLALNSTAFAVPS